MRNRFHSHPKICKTIKSFGVLEKVSLESPAIPPVPVSIAPKKNTDRVYQSHLPLESAARERLSTTVRGKLTEVTIVYGIFVSLHYIREKIRSSLDLHLRFSLVPCQRTCTED